MITSCEFCKKINFKMSDLYHCHHIEGHGIGETINLCSWHHNNLHGFIRKKAVQICEKYNPEFFREITDEYINNLKGVKNGKPL